MTCKSLRHQLCVYGTPKFEGTMGLGIGVQDMQGCRDVGWGSWCTCVSFGCREKLGLPVSNKCPYKSSGITFEYILRNRPNLHKMQVTGSGFVSDLAPVHSQTCVWGPMSAWTASPDRFLSCKLICLFLGFKGFDRPQTVPALTTFHISRIPLCAG